MMKIWISFGLLAVLFAYSWNFISSTHGEQNVIYTPSAKECFSQAESGFKYCIHQAKQGTNGGLVYVLHGRNLDEQTWNDDTYYTAMIQRYWEVEQKKPPTIVVVSFGPIWLLSKKGAAKKSGLMNTFIAETIPAIEKQLGFVPKYRAVMGESMGGLNSLILGLTNPRLFDRVAALCPALYKISPFDPISVMWQEIKSTGADPRTIFGIAMLARDYVQNSAEWDAINPLYLVKMVPLEPKSEFYLSSPLYDKYGIYEGAAEFVSLAKERGVKLRWQPLYGGHCAVDINSIAEFLL